MERLQTLREVPEEFIDLSIVQIKPGEKRTIFNGSDVPGRCSLNWLRNYSGISDKTFYKYRKIAFEHSVIYKTSALKRNPDYIAKKIRSLQLKQQGIKVKVPAPDPPPFTKIEICILLAIADLFSDFHNALLVKTHMDEHPSFYLKIYNR
jgi:hypothetical protein